MLTNPLGPELMRAEIEEFRRAADPQRAQSPMTGRLHAMLRRRRVSAAARP